MLQTIKHFQDTNISTILLLLRILYATLGWFPVA